MPVKAIPKLSEAVKRVLDEHGPAGKPLSIRQAELRSGLSYGVINAMASGRVPGADHIIKFAAAFEEDVVSWLELCDYQEIAGIIRALKREDRPGELERLLQIVPAAKRDAATTAAKQAIRCVIVPLLTEAA